MTHRSTRTNRRALAQRLCVLAALVAMLTIMPQRQAAADFRVCNNTSSRVGVAIGYKDKDGWATEGWWNLPSRSGCEVVLRGTLASRYYYIYAVDYDRGGEWAGQAFMCTRDKEFLIRPGIGDCLAHGYDRTGFFEVDTGDQSDWTVQLTESGESAKPGPSSPTAPGQSRPGPSLTAPPTVPAR